MSRCNKRGPRVRAYRRMCSFFVLPGGMRFTSSGGVITSLSSARWETRFETAFAASLSGWPPLPPSHSRICIHLALHGALLFTDVRYELTGTSHGGTPV